MRKQHLIPGLRRYKRPRQTAWTSIPVYIALLVVAAALLASARADVPGTPTTCPAPQPSLAERLQSTCVTVRCGARTGSGTLVRRGDHTYVLTAAHVVETLRTERSVIDADGITKKVVEFSTAAVVQPLYEGARRVGQIELEATAVRYSKLEDLAVLVLAKRRFVHESVTFYRSPTPPTVGSELYHVGSLSGLAGANSLTSGIVSHVGRVRNGQVYDQVSCPAFRGSSGGGVFLRSNGEYVGMVTRGAGETFNLMVPVRRIAAWCARVRLPWLLDASLPVPPLGEIRSNPCEAMTR